MSEMPAVPRERVTSDQGWSADSKAPATAVGEIHGIFASTEVGFVPATQIDAIKISKSGVWVGDKEMKGCTAWRIERDPGVGITEVWLRLLTPSLEVEFKAPGDHPNRIL